MKEKNLFNLILLSSIIVISTSLVGSEIESSINKHKNKFENIALSIWDYAELGYQEIKSSTALAESLKEEGFKITYKVANIPTAFIAEYGNNGPVIGILGEFDALPGLSQQNLLFEDVDIVFHWHPDDVNTANSRTSNSNKSAKFTFRGISAHAAGSPELGRSALDGVEAMNMMVNMMREHVPQESRIHYVITKGGLAPNVVPDIAEVYYYVRHPNMKNVEELFQRVVKTAEGAAKGTETQMTYEVMHGNYSLLPNETIQKIVHKNLSEIGGIKYTQKENDYAEEIYQTFIKPDKLIGSQEEIQDYRFSHSYGSTDVGDVSWVVPTAGMRAASWVPGTAAHSWQAVASGGTSIGLKGAELAAKTLSASAIEIYKNPEIIVKAKKELNERVGKDFKYKALLGDREPPLNYRVN